MQQLRGQGHRVLLRVEALIASGGRVRRRLGPKWRLSAVALLVALVVPLAGGCSKGGAQPRPAVPSAPPSERTSAAASSAEPLPPVEPTTDDRFTMGPLHFRQQTAGRLSLPALDEAATHYTPLRRALDAVRVAHRAAAADCGEMTETGVAHYEVAGEITWASNEYVVLHLHGELDCGGAHPNEIIEIAFYEVASGKDIGEPQWLDDSAQPQLRARLLERYRTDIPECPVLVENTHWRFWPTPWGLVLEPTFPHAAYACTEQVRLSYAEVWPLLTAEGKRALREFAPR